MTADPETVPTAWSIQAELAVHSATASPWVPHHPINCTGTLRYDLDAGLFSCDHVEVGPDDERTRACVTESIARLLVDLAFDLF